METADDETWFRLVELYDNEEVRWIGGIVQEYNNGWGFRFKPDTIIAASITIEGAQFYIQGISGDLEYWINSWVNVAYILVSIVEIHE